VKRSLYLPDLEATRLFAALLAAALPEKPCGWMILLQGELGSGKSTLARAMLRNFGYSGAVPSPTFTLVEPYELSGCPVYHVDLYRISHPEELEYLGWAELDDGLRLVEWPERVPGIHARADILVTLAYQGTGRTAELTALSDRGAGLVDQLTLP
jgi:tRNA threonylcarbamoyladenosine biosynthesis protein TsaE